MNTFTSPNSSPAASRPDAQVVRLSHGQVSQYQGRQSFDNVVRERNEMMSFIACFAMSRQEAKKKLERYSVLKIEVKDQLKFIFDRLIQLDDYENLVNEIVNGWDELIGVNYIPKTLQMQTIVTMTNELKMLVKILTQGRNVEEFQNSRFSPYCNDFFTAAVKARNNSQFLMRILEDIKLDLLQMRNQGKITEELYGGVIRQQPMRLFKEWRMLLHHVLKQEGVVNSPKESVRIRAGGFDRFHFNRQSALISKLQQEKQSLIEKNNHQETHIRALKKKILQHENEYSRLADELYKQKVSQERRQSVEDNPYKKEQLAVQQSARQSLEAALQSSKQQITNLQLRLNQSDSNYSRLFSQMQSKQAMWRQQRETLIRELQTRNSKLLELCKDQQQLQRSKDQLMKEKSHLQYMLNQKNELLDMESKKVAALNIMINQNEQTKRRLEQELAKERTNNSTPKPKELQQKLEELRLQNSLFSTQLVESKTSIERLTIQNSNLSKEHQELIEEKRRIQKALKSQPSIITMPTSPKRLEQTTRTINELNLTIKKLQARLRSKEQQLQGSNQQVESLNRMLQDMNYLGNSRTDNSALLSQYEQKIQNMEIRIAELQKNADAQVGLSSKLRETVKIKNEEIGALEKLLRQAQQKTANIKKYTMIISDLRQQNGQLKQALEQSNQKLKNLSARPDGSSISRINCLFQNDILENEPQHKRYLTEVIQSYMRMKIQKTRLVYAFDPNNKTNFHKYIDGKDNLVFIIKMLNGTYTAAYTEGPFQPRQASDRQGLIISLSSHKYFTLNEPNRRAITYDDYYIIFGNSEIRLRSQQKKLFSNFGIANSYYRSQGLRVTVLLGGSPQQRQLELDHYEVYQITFDV